jgi:hypothetical protein
MSRSRHVGSRLRNIVAQLELMSGWTRGGQALLSDKSSNMSRLDGLRWCDAIERELSNRLMGGRGSFGR